MVALPPAAAKPCFYFIGVTTGRSSIMRIFPRWAEALGLGDCQIKGIDLPLHAPIDDYRAVVEFIKHDPLSLGALVTTHKVALYRAAYQLFDSVDPHAELLGEVSCLSKRDGKLIGHAKDGETSGLALRAFIPQRYWREREPGAELLSLGVGGAGLAICWYWLQAEREDDRPARIVAADTSAPRLAELERVYAATDPQRRCPLQTRHVAAKANDSDKLLAALAAGSLVVNATGLGKDAPGSPLSDAARFPERARVWELNYRGERPFLAQAQAQRDVRQLHIEDGWNYFLYGWTRVISEVFALPIPTSGSEFEHLSELARQG